MDKCHNGDVGDNVAIFGWHGIMRLQLVEGIGRKCTNNSVAAGPTIVCFFVEVRCIAM